MAQEFHSELNSLELCLPGSQNTWFSDTDALRNFFNHQYPTWKAAWTVTPIPAGRVPRLFLKDDQMTPSYGMRMSALQKGETGEIEVYTSLLNAKDPTDGILVFPNVDGNFFQSSVAHVEIDIVVVHPRKGAFVFNVKNAKNVMESKLCEDMVKHCNFIRLILAISHSKDKTSDVRVPVHGVVCSLAKVVSLTSLKANGYFESAMGKEKRYIMQPSDVQNFSESWHSILSQVPNVEEECLDLIELLAVRLGCLNSMEGSIAMVHKQLADNGFHTIKQKEEDGVKILGDCITESLSNGTSNVPGQNTELLKKKMIALQMNKRKDKKVSFFLWTKEQQKIISHISASLLSKSSNPMRIIVSGPKGSGKTMLLVFIARLAKKIFSSQGIDVDGDVAINDGRLRNSACSLLLFEKLKMDFKDTGITVEDIKRTRMETQDMKRKSIEKLVLFDECIPNSFDTILESVGFGQNIILFTSVRPDVLTTHSKKMRSFKIFHLRNSLRSSCEIVSFVENFRLLDKETGECELIASHNLRGAAPNIQSIMVDEKSDPLHTGYIDAVLSVIGQTMNRGHGLDHILITPFVHQITLQRIICGVQKKGWDYEYRNPVDYSAKSTMMQIGIKNNPDGRRNNQALNGHPILTFSTGNHIDGAEYGAVIVLLERSLPCYWETYIHPSLFIAITRASTMLSIITNDTVNPPQIQHKQEFNNKDAVPIIWKDTILPRDVNIPAYELITCAYNEFHHHLGCIIQDSIWSKAPVLVLGEHKCLGSFKEIEQPNHVLVDERYVKDEEIKWYKVGTKMIVSAKKCDNSYMFFNREIYMDFMNGGFSALVFLAPSGLAFIEMAQQSRRHELLYYMHTELLENCPIYIMTSCPSNVRKTLIENSPNIDSICNFLSPCTVPSDAVMLHQAPGSANCNKEFLSQHWSELKEVGNMLFKNGDLEAALSRYTLSMEILEAEFNNSLSCLDINLLIQMQEERSKLCTNISKTYFDLASPAETCLDVPKMELSLQYAKESLRINPFWLKGQHREKEAKQVLLQERCPFPLEQMAFSNGYSTDEQYIIKRALVLKEKLKRSVGWEHLRYKENAVLVDRNGLGHYKTISEALLRSQNGKKPLSILINPGVYDEQVIIGESTAVDIVGNIEPEVCMTNQWILRDPPVVIQSTEKQTLRVVASTVFLSKLSLYNWCTDTGHAVCCEKYNETTSSVSLFECALKSMCGAAVVAQDGSNLILKACRSVETYAAVLGADQSNVTISHSYIQRTKMAGLEFRDCEGDIEQCSIGFCENPGIFATRSVIVIKSCLLETNSTTLTVNEGSIQLRECDATVQDTKILNQVGNGIVFEKGKGTFAQVTIDRCRSSGFLIQGPCSLKGCIISSCVSGITICNFINGDVILDNCTITRCKKQVDRSMRAIKPIVVGSHLEIVDCDVFGELKEDVTTIVPNIFLGQEIHERSLRYREFLLQEEDIFCRLRNAGETLRGCAYCTVLPISISDKHDCFLCKDCDAFLYCSIECCQKNKEAHHIECMFAQKHIQAYRESIDWQGLEGKVQEKFKNHGNDGDRNCKGSKKGKLRHSKKYRGPEDLVLEERSRKGHAEDWNIFPWYPEKC